MDFKENVHYSHEPYTYELNMNKKNSAPLFTAVRLYVMSTVRHQAVLRAYLDYVVST